MIYVAAYHLGSYQITAAGSTRERAISIVRREVRQAVEVNQWKWGWAKPYWEDDGWAEPYWEDDDNYEVAELEVNGGAVWR